MSPIDFYCGYERDARTSGAVTFGIGNMCDVTNFALKCTYSALAHGTFQGLMSGIQGGGFYAGFASGALSSIAGSYMNKLGGSGSYESGNYNLDGSCQVRNYGMDNQNLMVGLTLTSGAIMGGVGSDLAGGNFWKGAVTGLIVTGLNDLMHTTYNQMKAKDAFVKRFHKVDPTAVPKPNMESVNALLKDVDDLQTVRTNSGSYPIDIDLVSNSGDRGYTDHGRHTLYKNAFTSNYRLASTMFHEFYHAFQETYMGGLLLHNIEAKYGRIGDIFIAATGEWFPTKGKMEVERNAYSFELWLGNGNSYVWDGINSNQQPKR